MNKALVWFRNDLRIEDNPALLNSSKNNNVIGIYFEASEQRIKHYDSVSKIGFTYDCVQELKKELKALNIPLLIFTVRSYQDIPEQLLNIVKNQKISSIWFNNEYLINEIERDILVEKTFLSYGLSVHRFDADMIFAPNSIRKPDGRPYKVFTPYKKAWVKHHKLMDIEVLPRPKKQNFELSIIEDSNQDFSRDYRKDLWPAGSKLANIRLQKFLRKVDKYRVSRDIPSTSGTSMLSPYLAVGAISVKQCVQAIRDYYFTVPESFYTDTWLSELIWREFYRQAIIDNPQLAKHHAYKPDVLEPWVFNSELFNAWKHGLTGFPIIDAAMRQLKQTSWMHNRLRMNAAMFLCKLCQIDWREGEKYFMESLIDGDFASNNGGWQWCSSTGADAAPYFRIMNPTTQSKKIDPKGDFIKRFVPELKSLDAKSIHDPSTVQRQKLKYPMPIIDYKKSRQLILKLLA